MLCVGIDYHKKFSYGTIMNEKGEIVKQGVVRNSPAGVNEFINGAKGKEEVKAVMEATRNWDLMYDWLFEVVDEVKLVHPYKVKMIADSDKKTDKIASTVLANILRSDWLSFAYAHAPEKATRDARAILRQRMFFVRLQTMAKNRIWVLVDKHPEVEHPVKDIFSKAGIEWLKKVELPEVERKILDGDIRLLEELKHRIKESNGLVGELAKKDKRVKLLMSIHGIGEFFGVLLCFEIDDINRFRDDKKLHAYAGLVPSTYASGGKEFHGHITKHGNKWIRWAMVEALWPAIIKDMELRHYYLRLKKKKGANCAKVATAKRLLTIVYRVLKEGRYFESHPDSHRDFALAVSLLGFEPFKESGGLRTVHI